MKKRLLASLLALFNLVTLGIYVRRLFKKEVTVLAYHRVLDVGNCSQYKYDRELISATPEMFDAQLQFLKRHYDVIDLVTLNDRLRNNSITGKELVITFDDGFSDNYSNAFPLLKSHGIPGVFFVSTGYIGAQSTFWFNDVVCAINSADQLKFKLGKHDVDLSASTDNREQCIQQTLRYLKKSPNSDRIQAIGSLFKQLNYDLHNTPELEHPMTWDNVKEMHAAGMEIGSHTVSHPILSRLTEQELHDEIYNSKSILESQLNTPCNSIAYPVGGYDEFNQKVETLCQSAGYNFGLSYVSGINPPTLDNRYNMKRLHVEEFIQMPEFKLMLCLPELYSR